MADRRRRDARMLDEARRTRAMLWIMAIMLFLTVLAAALGLATRGVAAALETQLTGRLTIQIVEADPATRERAAAAALAAVRREPGVARAAPVDRAAIVGLLGPWLGSESDDPDLPVPALIDVDLRRADAASVAEIERAVKAAAPAARIDRHERWMAPVADFIALIAALAAALVLLMAAATGAVVVLAARAGLDTHRDTIEILHMLGSTDVQIARLFQRRIGRDTLAGGAIGGVAALAVVALVGVRIEALGSGLLGGVGLGVSGWVALALLPLAFALLATVAARRAVLRALGRLP